MPAHAIIAPLSVQSFTGGAINATPDCAEKRDIASRIAPLAATPPAMTIACAVPARSRKRPSATRMRSSITSTTAAWKEAQRSATSRGFSGAIDCAAWRVAVFNPDSEKSAFGRPSSGRGSANRVGIAAARGGLDRRAAGIGQAEQLGGLIERLADRVVHRRAQPFVLPDALDREDLGVAARGEQQQIGKREPAVQARDQRVRLEMVDGDQRLAGRQRDSFARHQADEHAADQSGSGRGGDAVEIARPDAGAFERASDQRVDDFDMGARGDFRHDAAISGMGRDLAHHLVGKDFAGSVGPEFDDRRGGLVAGGLDSQNAHRDGFGSRFEMRRRRRPTRVYTLGAPRDRP